jgi:DNA-binding GntR family transcriptional regulator
MAIKSAGNRGFKTAQEMVLNHLRQAISSSSIKPGQRIQQDELATHLGVSRMPVREALRQLEAEGLVTFFPHRGVVVADISVDDIEDIYIIRIALESAAARIGAENMSDEGLQYMRRTLADMEDTYYHFDPSHWLALNGVFHNAIYRAADNPHLFKLITSTNLTINPYIRTYIMMPDYLQQSVDEHRQILDAVGRRNGAEAEELTKAHLQHTADAVIGYLHRLSS